MAVSVFLYRQAPEDLPLFASCRCAGGDTLDRKM